MIDRRETAGPFTEADNLDKETRKINTESANQALVNRPRLRFDLLIKLGTLSLHFIIFTSLEIISFTS